MLFAAEMKKECSLPDIRGVGDVFDRGVFEPARHDDVARRVQQPLEDFFTATFAPADGRVHGRAPVPQPGPVTAEQDLVTED